MRLTPQQKADRRKGLGASDISEMMGISPFQGKSPLRLFAEKRGLLVDEDAEEETTEQKVGHALEGALVSLYEQESGFQCLTNGGFVESIAHPEHPWMRCNLDGRVVGKRAALEVKVVGIGMMRDWDTASDDGIPPYVRTQCYWQMHVADLDEVHVVYLCGTDFRVFYVLRDQIIIDAIVAEAHAFWRRVESGEIPPVDASSAAASVLAAMFPAPDPDVEVEATDEQAALLTSCIEAADAEKKAEEVKDIRRNRLRLVMGELGASILFSDTARATWKENAKGVRTLTVKASGGAKAPRITKRKANWSNVPELPAIDEGEVF